jgi:DNA-binding NarL/FixJ family response regulator
MNVLILDDNHLECKRIADEVSGVLGPGTSIDTANTTEEATQFLHDKDYELGIFDIRLGEPRLGTSFLNDLLQNGRKAPKSVVFVSNYADETTAVVASQMGSTLLPKSDSQLAGCSTPLRQVLIRMTDKTRDEIKLLYPGQSNHAQEVTEQLYLATQNKPSVLAIVGPEKSGISYISGALIRLMACKSAYPSLLIQRINCMMSKSGLKSSIQAELPGIIDSGFPHLILENIDEVNLSDLEHLTDFIERYHNSVKFILTGRDFSRVLRLEKMRHLIMFMTTLKPLGDRLPDLGLIASSILQKIDSGIPKKLSNDVIQYLSENPPVDIVSLREILVQAIANSGLQYYISREHFENPSIPDLQKEFQLNDGQEKGLKAFCELLKRLKAQGLDQVDIYRHITKLREPIFREDYQKTYQLENELPPRSTLIRILEKIKEQSHSPNLRNINIFGISIHELMAYRK